MDKSLCMLKSVTGHESVIGSFYNNQLLFRSEFVFLTMRIRIHISYHISTLTLLVLLLVPTYEKLTNFVIQIKYSN